MVKKNYIEISDFKSWFVFKKRVLVGMRFLLLNRKNIDKAF